MVFCKLLLNVLTQLKVNVGFILYMTTYVLVFTFVCEMQIMHQQMGSADNSCFLHCAVLTIRKCPMKESQNVKEERFVRDIQEVTC